MLVPDAACGRSGSAASVRNAAAVFGVLIAPLQTYLPMLQRIGLGEHPAFRRTFLGQSLLSAMA